MTIFVNFPFNKTRIEYRVKKEKENKLRETSTSPYLFG